MGRAPPANEFVSSWGNVEHFDTTVKGKEPPSVDYFDAPQIDAFRGSGTKGERLTSALLRQGVEMNDQRLSQAEMARLMDRMTPEQVIALAACAAQLVAARQRAGHAEESVPVLR